MDSISDLTQGSMENMDSTQFMTAMLEVKYPNLFHDMEQLFTALQDLKYCENAGIMSCLAQKIARETDDMYYKEKLVVFPYLQKLVNNKDKYVNHQSFEAVKQHYHKIMRALGELYTEVQSQADCVENKSTSYQILHLVNALETSLIKTQLMKETLLYGYFRQRSVN